MVEPDRVGVSWKPVVAALVGLPAVLSGLLWAWLGTSSMGSPDQLFERMQLAPVAAEQVHSLEYQGLWFAKLRFSQQQRADFIAQLKDFDVSEGPAAKPVALKLKRDWWDPPLGQEGRYWHKGLVTIWSPSQDLLVFYVVVDSPTSRRG